MQIKKTLASFIKKFDLFSQPITFRYNEQPEYQSVTGGVISIILIVIFIAIFSTTLFRTIDKQYINFNLSRHDLESPSYFSTTLENTFMFAVGISGLDMNSGQRYFDVYMQERQNNSTGRYRRPVPLVQCYREQWESRGYADTFDRLDLSKWLCPPEGTKLQLQGKFTSESFKFYKIAVTSCNPSLNISRPCVNSSTIETYLDAEEAFNFNYYFINTIINPGDETYLKTYLEDRNYFPFSPTDGVNANLFISSYVIGTDESLLPNEQVRTDEGGIVIEEAQIMNYKVRSSEYLKLFLRKSPISLQIQRSFRKVDDTFSYIGGLFGTILVFFGFVSMYNQLSYEIQVSRHAYYFAKNDPFDPRQFNILLFFVYVIFQFLDRFGITIPWPRLQRLHRFLEQGKKQMDVKLIINKIIYAEKLGLTLLNKNKHKALLLSQPFTLDQANQIRKDLNFYKMFRKKFFPNGQSLSDNQSLVMQELSKPIKDINLQLKQQSAGMSKIHPIGDDLSIMEPSSTQFIEAHTEKTKTLQPHEINEEEEFRELDLEMRVYIKELEDEADKNDEVAKKLLQKIDMRIKERYLKAGEKSPKKLKPIKYALRQSINMINLED